MEILNYRAFTTGSEDPTSGNPAGVVIDADGLSETEMLTIAASLGHSETAFLSAVTPSSVTVRYFTPRDEIAFCGHATIASGVALARRGSADVVSFETKAGTVPVEVAPDAATLVAVESSVHPLAENLLDDLLDALGLVQADLDPALPPAFVHGGNPHPLLFVKEGVLATLDHDDTAVLTLQDREGWDGTTPVVNRIAPGLFASRNPFPRGGIREDPATGSAGASLGYYLRAGEHVETPAVVRVEQGRETGHPSLITVSIPMIGRVRVTGTATEMETD